MTVSQHLLDAAYERQIHIPAKATLLRYGFGFLPEAINTTTDPAGDWLMMLEDQSWTCGVCGKLPSISERYGYVRLVTDHEHVKGWKTMPPEQRRAYVRGILCYWCNKTYVGRGITVEKAAGVLEYLKRYKARRPGA